MGIGLTLQQFEGWRAQLARVARWRQCVTIAANGEPSADELDFLMAFFERAYHFRDWLTETRAVSEVEVDEYVAGLVDPVLLLWNQVLKQPKLNPIGTGAAS